MKPSCINHPNLNAVAKGLCSACYMRARRAAKSPTTGRRQNGENYMFALKHPDGWIHRFCEKIERDTETACHTWTAGKTDRGYGVMHVANMTLLAHRLSFAINGGDPMATVVMHTCDNPSCVNPEHLRAGSYADNMADMDAKGRRVVGKAGEHLKNRESHPRARPVMTPMGEFKSASLAAEGTGLTARTIARYCQKQLNGYKYI
jgi:hypothetical protein